MAGAQGVFTRGLGTVAKKTASFISPPPQAPGGWGDTLESAIYNTAVSYTLEKREGFQIYLSKKKVILQFTLQPKIIQNVSKFIKIG